MCFGVGGDEGRANIVFALAAAKGPCEAVEWGGGLSERTSASEGGAVCRRNCGSNSIADISAAIVLPPRSRLFFCATHVVGEAVGVQRLQVAHCREMLTNTEKLSSLT